MMKEFLDQNFEKLDLAGEGLAECIYDGCTFTSCSFSGTNLAGARFIDCSFESCDLSNAVLEKTAFQNVRFTGCKMLGLQFDLCDTLGMDIGFSACVLKHASFYGLKLSDTIFRECNLGECDFTAADLDRVLFESCDLSGAVFTDCRMEETDFRGARNYLIDPATNYLKRTRFSMPEVLGLLGHLDIEIES